MITFKKRLGIYVALWVLAAFAFAVAPFARSDYPELQERVHAFFEVPLELPIGIMLLAPSSSNLGAVLFCFSVLYLVAHAVATFALPRRRPFFALCAMQLLHIAVAVVSAVRFSWSDRGP